MPPKKNKSNSFILFVKEWRKRTSSKLEWTESIKKAGEIWKLMTPDERAPYIDVVNNAYNRAKALSSTEAKSEAPKPNQQEIIHRHIEKIVNDSVKRAKLETQLYCFVMVNYFTNNEKSDVCTPAELAVSKFSLESGVHHVYHTLVNPGYNPIGSLSQIKEHAAKSHQLPYPPNALGNADMQQVYKAVLQFIGTEDGGNDKLPPIYTLQEHINVVKNAFKYLNAGEASKLNVYPIEYLFYMLKEAVCVATDLPSPKSINETNMKFTMDEYQYESNLGCQYHKERNISQHCANSFVIRWGFMFANYMCSDLAIKMKPNRHIPCMASSTNNIIEPSKRNGATVLLNQEYEPSSSPTKTKIKTEADESITDSWKSYIDQAVLHPETLEALNDLENIFKETEKAMAVSQPIAPQLEDDSAIFTRRPKCELKIEIDDSEVQQLQLPEGSDSDECIENPFGNPIENVFSKEKDYSYPLYPRTRSRSKSSNLRRYRSRSISNRSRSPKRQHLYHRRSTSRHFQRSASPRGEIEYIRRSISKDLEIDRIYHNRFSSKDRSRTKLVSPVRKRNNLRYSSESSSPTSSHNYHSRSRIKRNNSRYSSEASSPTSSHNYRSRSRLRRSHQRKISVSPSRIRRRSNSDQRSHSSRHRYRTHLNTLERYSKTSRRENHLSFRARSSRTRKESKRSRSRSLSSRRRSADRRNRRSVSKSRSFTSSPHRSHSKAPVLSKNLLSIEETQLKHSNSPYQPEPLNQYHQQNLMQMNQYPGHIFYQNCQTYMSYEPSQNCAYQETTYENNIAQHVLSPHDLRHRLGPPRLRKDDLRYRLQNSQLIMYNNSTGLCNRPNQQTCYSNLTHLQPTDLPYYRYNQHNSTVYPETYCPKINYNSNI